MLAYLIASVTGAPSQMQHCYTIVKGACTLTQSECMPDLVPAVHGQEGFAAALRPIAEELQELERCCCCASSFLLPIPAQRGLSGVPRLQCGTVTAAAENNVD